MNDMVLEELIAKGNSLQGLTYQIYQKWEELLVSKGLPKYSTGIHVSTFEELKLIIDNSDKVALFNLIEMFVSGKTVIFKNTFTHKQIDLFKSVSKKLAENTESTFFKMADGVPNFHRVISEGVSSNYYANPVKHSHYFFPWNPGSTEIFKIIWPIWGYFKVLGGYRYDQYIKNLPRDGIIDRIQIVRYPAGGGKLDAHFDPYHGMRPVPSTYMSKRGVDFFSGGAYALREDGGKDDIEPNIAPGDCSCLYPSVLHGVDAIDLDSLNVARAESGSGRWWLGMYCNDSDMVKNRRTGGVPD